MPKNQSPKTPLRVWMTGGVAIIVAALGNPAAATDDERLQLSGVSRHGLHETVQRIEAVAQARGLPVIARVSQAGDRQVIVLASSQGGTPVTMASDHARPELLMSVVVQARAGGPTEVLLHAAQPEAMSDGVPSEVRFDLARLPSVVAQALA